MKFKGSAEFEWQEDSYGGLDLAMAENIIGWIVYREIDAEVYYAICDKKGQIAALKHKTIDEAKIALLKHFGIEVSE